MATCFFKKFQPSLFFVVVVVLWGSNQICLLKQSPSKELSDTIQLSRRNRLISKTEAFFTLLVPNPGVVLNGKYCVVLAPCFFVVEMHQTVVGVPSVTTLLFFMNCPPSPTNQAPDVIFAAGILEPFANHAFNRVTFSYVVKSKAWVAF
jgi:hypothetical protein